MSNLHPSGDIAVDVMAKAYRFQDMLSDRDEDLQRASKRRYRRAKVNTRAVMAEYLAGELA